MGTARSAIPVVKRVDVRDINNALGAVDSQLRVLNTAIDTVNLKVGQSAISSANAGGTLTLLQQQVNALIATVSALSSTINGPTGTYRADTEITEGDPVFPSSSGGVSAVDTQDPTAIFAVFGVATSNATPGANVVIRTSGVMSITGADFEAGRAVYAQLGSGLTQHPNYADVAIPIGVAITAGTMDVRAAWPAIRETPLYPGGYEDFLPVVYGLVREAIGLEAQIGALATGLLVKTGTSTYAVRQLVAGANITITNPTGVPGNIVISSTGGGGELFHILTEDDNTLVTENNESLTQEFRDWVAGWILTEDGQDELVTESEDIITSE